MQDIVSTAERGFTYIQSLTKHQSGVVISDIGVMRRTILAAFAHHGHIYRKTLEFGKESKLNFRVVTLLRRFKDGVHRKPSLPLPEVVNRSPYQPSRAWNRYGLARADRNVKEVWIGDLPTCKVQNSNRVQYNNYNRLANKEDRTGFDMAL